MASRGARHYGLLSGRPMRGPLVGSWTPLLAVMPAGSSLKSTTVAYKTRRASFDSRNFSIVFQCCRRDDSLVRCFEIRPLLDAGEFHPCVGT